MDNLHQFKIYSFKKPAAFGIGAGILLLIIFALFIWNILTHDTFYLFGNKNIVIPNFLIKLCLLFCIGVMGYIILLTRVRMFDLFGTVPVLVVTKQSLNIRRLLNVDCPKWDDIHDVKFIKQDDYCILYIEYSDRFKTNRVKKFRYRVKMLDISQEKLMQLLFNGIDKRRE